MVSTSTLFINGLENVHILDNNKTLIFQFVTSEKAKEFTEKILSCASILSMNLLRCDHDPTGETNFLYWYQSRCRGFTIKTIGMLTKFKRYLKNLVSLPVLPILQMPNHT
jgi:hypothetical protein